MALRAAAAAVLRQLRPARWREPPTDILISVASGIFLSLPQRELSQLRLAVDVAALLAAVALAVVGLLAVVELRQPSVAALLVAHLLEVEPLVVAAALAVAVAHPVALLQQQVVALLRRPVAAAAARTSLSIPQTASSLTRPKRELRRKIYVSTIWPTSRS